MAQPDETAIPHTVTLVDGQRAVWIAGPTCVRHELVAEIHFPEQMERLIAWVRGRTDAARSVISRGRLPPGAPWQSILLRRVDPRGAEADDQRRQGCSLRQADAAGVQR